MNSGFFFANYLYSLLSKTGQDRFFIADDVLLKVGYGNVDKQQ